MSGHVLRLNKLVLSDGGDPNPAGTAYTFQVLADEFGMGDTTPIETVMESFLQDGAVVVTKGLDNREVSFRVVISGPDSGALADGEAALFAEVGKPGELGWTPPDGWAPETVFDVFTSKLDFRFDDLTELRQGERAYVLTLTCFPYTRSATTVVTPALPVPSNPDPTPVSNTVSSASSLTGWAKSAETTSLDAGTDANGGYLSMAAPPITSAQATYTPTSPVPLNGTPYIVIHCQSFASYENKYASVYLNVNGVPASKVSTEASALYLGWMRITYRTTETIVSNLSIRMYMRSGEAGNSRRLRFRNVTATNTATASGTSRQGGRTIDVAGAARTAGSLRVWHETANLENVLVYTQARGTQYNPSGRQYVTSLGDGQQTTDSARVSGASSTFANSYVVASIPGGAYVRGAHNVLALVKADTAGTYRVDSAIYSFLTANGTRLGSDGLRQTTVQLTTGYQWVSLFSGMFGHVDSAADSTIGTTLQFRVQHPTDTSKVVTWDQFVFLNIDAGSVTAINGVAAKSLWVDGPTVETPRPRTFVGNAAERSDAYTPMGFVAYGNHQFAPPVTAAWIVTSGAQAASAEFRHYPRWHTHASDVPAA